MFTKILSIATEVPKIKITQLEVINTIKKIFSKKYLQKIEKMIPVYKNSGVKQRFGCVPMDWHFKYRGWKERNSTFIKNATQLVENAIVKCLEKKSIKIKDIDAIVSVSSTGIATPTIEALIVEKFSMSRYIKRLPIFGLGCAGGVLGLARAADLAKSMPGKKVLFFDVEVCSVNFQSNDFSKKNIIASALFGDGAAAAVLSTEGEGINIENTAEYTWKSSLDIMGWEITDSGLGVIFSRNIPKLIKKDFRKITNTFLKNNNLELKNIKEFIPHPGGAKVLDALEEVYDLKNGKLNHSRQILKNYGNMSSATVLFILERAIDKFDNKKKGRYLMTALGPGFTSGFMNLKINNKI